jgi:hypothetical protein
MKILLILLCLVQLSFAQLSKLGTATTMEDIKSLGVVPVDTVKVFGMASTNDSLYFIGNIQLYKVPNGTDSVTVFILDKTYYSRSYAFREANKEIYSKTPKTELENQILKLQEALRPKGQNIGKD